MRFHSAALSGGLLLSSLSGTAAQDASNHSKGDHPQPSVRRQSNVEASGTRKDSIFDVFKRFIPDVEIPVPFGFNNDHNPEEKTPRHPDAWSSSASSDQASEKQPLGDLPSSPLASRSTTTKSMMFPRRALSTRESSSKGSPKNSSTIRPSSSGRVIKPTIKTTSSTKKTVSVTRGAPLSRSSTRNTTSQNLKTSTQTYISSKKASSPRRITSPTKIFKKSSKTSSLSRKISSSSRITRPIRGSKISSLVKSSSTKRSASSGLNRSTSRDSTSTKRPSISTKKPSSTVNKPSNSTDKASSSTRKGSSFTKQASSSSRKPLSSSKNPPSSSKNPPSSSRKPSIGTKLVSSSSKPISNSTKKAVSSTQKVSRSTHRASNSLVISVDSAKTSVSFTKPASTSIPKASQASSRTSAIVSSIRGSSLKITQTPTRGSLPSVLSRPTRSTVPSFHGSSQLTIKSTSKKASSISSKVSSPVRGSAPKVSPTLVHVSSSTSESTPTITLNTLNTSSESLKTSSVLAATTRSRECRGFLSCPPEVSIGTPLSLTKASFAQTSILSATSRTSASVEAQTMNPSLRSSQAQSSESQVPGSVSSVTGNIAIQSDLVNPERGRLPLNLSTFLLPTTTLVFSSTARSSLGSSQDLSASPTTTDSRFESSATSSSIATSQLTSLSVPSLSSLLQISATRDQLSEPTSSSSEGSLSSQVESASHSANSIDSSPDWVIGSGNLAGQSSSLPSYSSQDDVSRSRTVTSQITGQSARSTASTSIFSGSPLYSPSGSLLDARNSTWNSIFTTSVSSSHVFSSTRSILSRFEPTTTTRISSASSQLVPVSPSGSGLTGSQSGENTTNFASSSTVTLAQSSTFTSSPVLDNESFSAASTAINTLMSLGYTITASSNSRSDSVISLSLPSSAISIPVSTTTKTSGVTDTRSAANAASSSLVVSPGSASSNLLSPIDGSATLTGGSQEAAGRPRTTSTSSVLVSFASFSFSNNRDPMRVTSDPAAFDTNTGVFLAQSTRSSSISIVVPDTQPTPSSSSFRSGSIGIEIPTVSGDLIASSFLSAAESASHTIDIVTSSGNHFASTFSTSLGPSSDDGSPVGTSLITTDQLALPTTVPLVVSTSMDRAHESSNSQQATETSVALSELTTPSSSIGANSISESSSLGTAIISPSSLSPIVQQPTIYTDTSDYVTLASTESTSDVSTRTYPYNIKPVSTIVTQTTGLSQYSTFTFPSDDVQSSESPAQQTSVDTTSGIDNAASSSDGAAPTTLAANSYIQQPTSATDVVLTSGNDNESLPTGTSSSTISWPDQLTGGGASTTQEIISSIDPSINPSEAGVPSSTPLFWPNPSPIWPLIPSGIPVSSANDTIQPIQTTFNDPSPMESSLAASEMTSPGGPASTTDQLSSAATSDMTDHSGSSTDIANLATLSVSDYWTTTPSPSTSIEISSNIPSFLSPSETSPGSFQGSVVETLIKSTVIATNFPSLTTDGAIPSIAVSFSDDITPTSVPENTPSDSEASPTFQSINLPTQAFSTEFVASSLYASTTKKLPTMSPEIELFPNTSVSLGPEIGTSEIGVILPATETQATLATASFESFIPLLTNSRSGPVTDDVSLSFPTAIVTAQSSLSSVQDTPSASPSAELSIISTSAISSAEPEFSSSIEPVASTFVIQPTAITASDGLPDASSIAFMISTESSDTPSSVSALVGVNQQMSGLTTFAAENIATALPRSSVDNQMVTSTALESQELPTSTSFDNVSTMIPTDITSTTQIDGSSIIFASASETPDVSYVSNTEVDPIQILESSAQIPSFSGSTMPSITSGTALSESTSIVSPITAIAGDQTESASIAMPAPLDLSASGLTSGYLEPSDSMSQQTIEPSSDPSSAFAPPGLVASGILPSITSDIISTTSNTISTSASGLSIVSTPEVIKSTDVLSSVNSTAQITTLDGSATTSAGFEMITSQIDPIFTGLSTVAPDTDLNSEVATQLLTSEPTVSAPVPSGSNFSSAGDDTISSPPSIPASPTVTTSLDSIFSTAISDNPTLVATAVLNPSVSTELGFPTETIISQPPEIDLNSVSGVWSSPTSIETVSFIGHIPLTSATESIPSPEVLGSKTNVIESAAIETPSTTSWLEVVDSLSATISGDSSVVSTLVSDQATKIDPALSLSVPVTASSFVADGATSTMDQASIRIATSISMGVPLTSTTPDVILSELEPTSSTSDEILSTTTSVGIDQSTTLSSIESPPEITDLTSSISITALQSMDDVLPTTSLSDDSTDHMSSSVGPSITSILPISGVTSMEAILETSEPILTAIASTSSISLATASLAGDSSVYAISTSSTELESAITTAAIANVSINLGVVSDPEGTTSNLETPSSIDGADITPTTSSDDQSLSIDPTSVVSEAIGITAPGDAVPSDTFSTPITTDSVVLSTSAIDDFSSSITNSAVLTFVSASITTFTLDIPSLSPSSVYTSNIGSIFPSSDNLGAQPSVVATDVSPLSSSTDASTSIIQTAISQVETVSSALGSKSAGTYSDGLASATIIPSIDPSSVATLNSDILGAPTPSDEVPTTSLLYSESQSLPTSTFDTGVPESIIQTETSLPTISTDTLQPLLNSSTLDNGLSVALSSLTQPTGMPLITSNPGIDSEAFASSTTNVEPTLESTPISPLTTDLPSNTSSDLASITTTPELPETGVSYVDTSSASQDASSISSTVFGSYAVESEPILTGALTETTNLPSTTSNPDAKSTSTVSDPSFEVITDASTLPIIPSAVSYLVSPVLTASEPNETSSASIVLDNISTSSTVVESEFSTPVAVPTQATDLPNVVTSSFAQSDAPTSSVEINEATSDMSIPLWPSSLPSSLDPELLSSTATFSDSVEVTATIVGIGSASTGLSSLTRDDASTISNVPAETGPPAVTTVPVQITDLPTAVSSSIVDLGMSISTGTTETIVEESSLKPMTTLPTVSVESELLLSATAEPTDTIPVSVGLGYASSSALPVVAQPTSSEEETSTVIINPAPSNPASLVDASSAELAITFETPTKTPAASDFATLSGTTDSTPTEVLSTVASDLESAISTSPFGETSTDSLISILTSLPAISSVIISSQASSSVEQASSSAAVASSPVPISIETSAVDVISIASSSTSKIDLSAVSSLPVTSQPLDETTTSQITDLGSAPPTLNPLVSSSIFDSVATSLPSSFTASLESVATTNPSLSLVTTFGGASTSALETPQSLATLLDTFPQTTSGKSLIISTSDDIQASIPTPASPTIPPPLSNDLTSSVVQSTLDAGSIQTAFTDSFLATSIDQAATSTAVLISASTPTAQTGSLSIDVPTSIFASRPLSRVSAVVSSTSQVVSIFSSIPIFPETTPEMASSVPSSQGLSSSESSVILMGSSQPVTIGVSSSTSIVLSSNLAASLSRSTSSSIGVSSIPIATTSLAVEASLSMTELGSSKTNSLTSITIIASSSLVMYPTKSRDPVSQSSPSAVSFVSNPMSSIGVPQISSDEVISSSSMSPSVVSLTFNSATSATSSATMTGYLINVGVGDTSVGAVQTAGGSNLANIGAGSLASTEASASAANPITTAVDSIVGSPGAGTTVLFSTSQNSPSSSSTIAAPLSSAQPQGSLSSQSASSSAMTTSSTSASMPSSPIITSSTWSTPEFIDVSSLLATSQSLSTALNVISASSSSLQGQSASSSQVVLASGSSSTLSSTVILVVSAQNSLIATTPSPVSSSIAVVGVMSALPISQATPVFTSPASATSILVQSSNLTNQVTSSPVSSSVGSPFLSIPSITTSAVVTSSALSAPPTVQSVRTLASSNVGPATISWVVQASSSPSSQVLSSSSNAVVASSTLSSLTIAVPTPSSTIVAISSVTSILSTSESTSTSPVVGSAAPPVPVSSSSSQIVSSSGSSSVAATSIVNVASSSPSPSVSSTTLSVVSISVTTITSRAPPTTSAVTSVGSPMTVQVVTSNPISSAVGASTAPSTSAARTTSSSLQSPSTISYATATGSCGPDGKAIGVAGINVLGGNKCTGYLVGLGRRDEPTTLETVYKPASSSVAGLE